MGKIIAFVNNKGGVGKTTSVLNLGAGLAKMGERVLLIDTDPQANLSISFKINDLTDNNLGNFLIGSKSWEEILISHQLPDGKFIDIVPAARQMQNTEKLLFSENAREKKLKKLLDKEKVKENYTYILIDCGPNLGLLTQNALCAADEFIIAFESEFFSQKGTVNILEFAYMFKDPDLNPNLDLFGILITQYNENMRGKAIKEITQEVRTSGVADKVFKTYIRRNIKLMESPMHGKNIFDYAPDSNGAADYLNLTKEFLERQTNNNNGK
jgi:chromosome partitioning protein